MAQCPHGNSMPDDRISALHISQGGPGRHRCAICAYSAGVGFSGGQASTWTCPQNSSAPSQILSGLVEYQAYPVRHKCTACAFIDGVTAGAASPDLDTIEIVDQAATGSSADIEGTPSWRIHRTYERNPRNRAMAIVLHGNNCLGCGFSFDVVYTSGHARGYIEVHHIRPLSEGPMEVDPRHDLIPLCANCHRMVHRRTNQWLGLEALQQLLNDAQQETNDVGE